MLPSRTGDYPAEEKNGEICSSSICDVLNRGDGKLLRMRLGHGIQKGDEGNRREARRDEESP